LPSRNFSIIIERGKNLWCSYIYPGVLLESLNIWDKDPFLRWKFYFLANNKKEGKEVIIRVTIVSKGQILTKEDKAVPQK
jgi:hypothetical protein